MSGAGVESSNVNLKAGQILANRFRIISLLGRGSVGTVYLADDCVRSSNVALKVVLMESRTAAEQIMCEIENNTKITDYTHVIQIYDPHRVPWGGAELLAVSMEYADGGSLRSWLCRNTADIQRRRSEGLALF